MRAALAATLALGCGAAPPARAPISSGPDAPHTAYPTKACVADFIAREPLRGPRHKPYVERVPEHGPDEAPHYYTFELEYGQENDCEAGCFDSHARGVALSCDRIGWYRVDDYEQSDERQLHVFHPRADDTLLYDEALWKDVPAAYFFEWLAKDPGVPEAVRVKAGAMPDPAAIGL